MHTNQQSLNYYKGHCNVSILRRNPVQMEEMCLQLTRQLDTEVCLTDRHLQATQLSSHSTSDRVSFKLSLGGYCQSKLSLNRDFFCGSSTTRSFLLRRVVSILSQSYYTQKTQDKLLSRTVWLSEVSSVAHPILDLSPLLFFFCVVVQALDIQLYMEFNWNYKYQREVEGIGFHCIMK